MENERLKDGSYIINGETIDKETVRKNLETIYNEVADAEDDEEFIPLSQDIKNIQYERTLELLKDIVRFAESSPTNLYYILHKQRIFNEEEYLYLTEWKEGIKIKYPQAELRKWIKKSIDNIPLRTSDKKKLKKEDKTQEEDRFLLARLIMSETEATLKEENKYSLVYKKDSLIIRITKSVQNNQRINIYAYTESSGRRSFIDNIEDIIKNLNMAKEYQNKFMLLFI